MVQRAVAREAVHALRREIARIEGRLPERLAAGPSTDGKSGDEVFVRRSGLAEGGLLATGARRLDEALGGGLSYAALTEIHGRETRDAGAVAGFALGLVSLALRRKPGPLLWVAAGDMFDEAGKPYAPGMASRFGIPPQALLTATARRLEDAFWVAEEAAAQASLGAVVLEVRGAPRKLDLTATQRLHHRAAGSARPVFLLREAGHPEPTAAPVRLVVSPAPAGRRRTVSGPLTGSIGPPAFTVRISRSRTAIARTVTLEWNRDECLFHERPRIAAGRQDHGAMVSSPGNRSHPAGQAGAVLAFGDVA